MTLTMNWILSNLWYSNVCGLAFGSLTSLKVGTRLPGSPRTTYAWPLRRGYSGTVAPTIFATRQWSGPFFLHFLTCRFVFTCFYIDFQISAILSQCARCLIHKCCCAVICTFPIVSPSCFPHFDIIWHPRLHELKSSLFEALSRGEKCVLKLVVGSSEVSAIDAACSSIVRACHEHLKICKLERDARLACFNMISRCSLSMQ